MDTKTAFLMRTALFKGANPQLLERLAAQSNIRTLHDGQMLFQAGDPAHHFYIVQKGWIKLFQLNPSGDEAVVALFKAGESFAEAVVFGRRPYPVNAMAVEDTTLLSISYQAMAEFIKADYEATLRLFSVIAMRQQYLVRRIEQMTLQSAPQRLGHFLLELLDTAGGDTLRLPYDKGLIAGRLNMKGETFSRALNTLRREAGVECKGRDVRILNQLQLKRFCEA